jgi:hypothetical protein
MSRMLVFLPGWRISGCSGWWGGECSCMSLCFCGLKNWLGEIGLEVDFASFF